MGGPDWMEGAPHPISKILVANRGEIACRIFRSCAELGLGSVAIYSEADRGSLHQQTADESVFLPGDTLSETYLNIEAILAAAEETGADAIHPGYGFLSERSSFANAVKAAGLVWIGPSAHAIDEMGDKISARRAMVDAGVPVIPGEELPLEEPENMVDELVRAATRVGYPLLLKASAGGGGKGMRVVREPRNLQREYTAASREAATSFGDGTVYVERLLEKSRHVEVQVLADSQGNVVHLFERECSIQRRHQKVVEESPSPVLDESTRQQMGQAAVNAAKAVDYEGAGTVEFLLAEDGDFHFLEMNTRLQVEHPITECIVALIWSLNKFELLPACLSPLLNPIYRFEAMQLKFGFMLRILPMDSFLPLGHWRCFDHLQAQAFDWIPGYVKGMRHGLTLTPCWRN